MKAHKCPNCGASLPDSGTDKVTCSHCGTTLLLGGSKSQQLVIRMRSKVALSKQRQIENQRQSSKITESIWAGSYHAEVKGPIQEIDMEMPGGLGYIHARADPSQRQTDTGVDIVSHELGSEEQETPWNALYVWMMDHVHLTVAWARLFIVIFAIISLLFVCFVLAALLHFLLS
jgi:uncharacterized Zn finger protein (UPF0148 family)